ncbi:hypothetical protein BU23DRAFT_604156 [Bimuria novae-zelandiae CBS 107.79]|uniref:Uncharacterized protein n=1 Tax=Bimuria novae-zelandiae CBS 107.79 TaxID=1447943 RepID=A0A6A5UKU8_9PLEO|nr:hypothetical protein BU23DRAFT_604156 [Bimuria novae-zelandiae CBS 107.79]
MHLGAGCLFFVLFNTRRQQLLASVNEQLFPPDGEATSSGDIRQSSSRGRSQGRSRRSTSTQSSSSRMSSPAQGYRRALSQNLLQQVQAQAQTPVTNLSSEYIKQLKHRREEADVVEREEGVKRLKIENEERLLKLEMERVDLEERKLALIERKKAAGLPI